MFEPLGYGSPGFLLVRLASFVVEARFSEVG